MNRVRDILIFALCILLALAPAVHANSGPSYWEGTTAAGLTVTGGECPIEVEHENLTFDIPELPLEYYPDESAFGDYTAHVTAEYTFRNPTDADVTVELLFPFGTAPEYAPDGRMLTEKYTVTADGAPVEAVLRHSLSWGDFDMAADSARLLDGFLEHSFYSPELPVTRYRFQPAGVQWERLDILRAKLRLDTDPERTKYIMDPANSYETEQDHALAGCALNSGETVTVYVLGEAPEKELEWTLFMEGEPIGGTMECVDTEQTTLKELLLSSRSADSGVSETDWYNAAVERMRMTESARGFLEWENTESLNGYLLCWYQYELTIPAGGSVVNSVTAPVYPDIHMGWEPEIYTYEYLLSPAKGWADFGTLDITVKTPCHMTESNLEGFEETENGYALHLDGLPEKELEFVLCSSAHPNRPGTRGERAIAAFAVLVAAAIFALHHIRRRKKKRD